MHVRYQRTLSLTIVLPSSSTFEYAEDKNHILRSGLCHYIRSTMIGRGSSPCFFIDVHSGLRSEQKNQMGNRKVK